MKIQLHYFDGRRETINVPWNEPRFTVEVADIPTFDFRIDAAPVICKHKVFKRVGCTDVYEES